MANPMNRVPRTSEDFIKSAKTAGADRQTKSAKAATLNRILNSNLSKQAGMERIAQGFVGPVMMRLKYEGVVRNVLTEDPIAPGQVPVYDVLDEMGRAYFLENYQAEAVISQYEGKRVQFGFRHLAAFPTVQEMDYYELTVDALEYAVNEARQRIQEEEDDYLFALLDVAVDEFTADTPDFSGQTTHHIVAASDKGCFMPGDFLTARAKAAKNRLEAKNVLMNPSDAYDMFRWNTVEASVNFANKVFEDGDETMSFMGFNIRKSVRVPDKTAYVLADPDYVGRMPIRKELEVRDNPQVERFSVGMVMDERINEVILNSNSIYRITKQ